VVQGAGEFPLGGALGDSVGEGDGDGLGDGLMGGAGEPLNGGLFTG